MSNILRAVHKVRSKEFGVRRGKKKVEREEFGVRSSAFGEGRKSSELSVRSSEQEKEKSSELSVRSSEQEKKDQVILFLSFSSLFTPNS